MIIWRIFPECRTGFSEIRKKTLNLFLDLEFVSCNYLIYRKNFLFLPLVRKMQYCICKLIKDFRDNWRIFERLVVLLSIIFVVSGHYLKLRNFYDITSYKKNHGGYSNEKEYFYDGSRRIISDCRECFCYHYP